MKIWKMLLDDPTIVKWAWEGREGEMQGRLSLVAKDMLLLSGARGKVLFAESSIVHVNLNRCTIMIRHGVVWSALGKLIASYMGEDE